MLSVTINGRAYGPRDVRDELSMNDFLREYLGMTGTKFGCGAAQCLSCAVIIDNPDGTSYTSPTCVVPAASFDGKSIRTVEGHAKNGELSALQKAFIEHFAFQWGYCTAGFLNESQMLLERLAKKPIARPDLEKTIAEALDGHLSAPATSNITRPCATSSWLTQDVMSLRNGLVQGPFRMRAIAVASLLVSMLSRIGSCCGA
jgi:aerobic-type carbon monoxide dehydrogenase small subunit (CoxS/CutS family)